MIISESVGGLIWFVLTVYVLYLILTAPADSVNKLLWVLTVLALPILGPVLYLLIGPGSGRAAI